ncbi:34058_t:CDS:2 [Gigaspora margarita]|uniref:34058_t:CDS:1 n=1 Tax=Gigaspora margarita TaxID=4874 RepID=A0ABN7WK95_GIGMA|nr:34058_t:CDS:2 [Gigaspora margarita]
MDRISPKIKEGAKVSVLGPVVGESIAHPLLGELWKTKRLLATGQKPVSTSQCINNNLEESSSSETDIFSGSDSKSSQNKSEAINTNNRNNIQWINEIATIDPRQVSRSYSSTPVVYIADIPNAMPRQFFEQFMPVDFIVSIVVPATNRHVHECETGWIDLTWMEFIRFIGILTIMTYVKCADICDYWSTKQETSRVLLTFGQYMTHQ